MGFEAFKTSSVKLPWIRASTSPRVFSKMESVKHEAQLRSPQGDPLDPDSMAALRALIAERGVRSLVVPLGVSITALTRAVAGMRVLAGTRALIRQGLAALRESERPRVRPRNMGEQ